MPDIWSPWYVREIKPIFKLIPLCSFGLCKHQEVFDYNTVMSYVITEKTNLIMLFINFSSKYFFHSFFVEAWKHMLSQNSCKTRSKVWQNIHYHSDPGHFSENETQFFYVGFTTHNVRIFWPETFAKRKWHHSIDILLFDEWKFITAKS